MGFFEIIIVISLIFFQSIFGVGLLIFGTPTFLLLGYNFDLILSLLVPISCTISLLQFIFSKDKIKEYVKKFTLYSSIPLILCLYLSINLISLEEIKIFIALIMIFISIINIINFNFLYQKFKLVKNFYLYSIIIGGIHGLTNLGGGFLSIFSSMVFYKNINKTRTAIAFGYLFFGLLQISLLLILERFTFKIELKYLIPLTLLIFYCSNFFFNKFNYKYFVKSINLIIFLYGFIFLFFGIIK